MPSKFTCSLLHRTTGMRPRKVKGVWVYPHSADVLAAAHLQPIAYYIQRRRHTVHNTIRDRDVLKECKGAERRRGTPPRLFWTEQDMTVPEARVYGPEEGEFCERGRSPTTRERQSFKYCWFVEKCRLFCGDWRDDRRDDRCVYFRQRVRRHFLF